ncbi:FapA family protein [Azonexus sp.]|uniref:DUF342 domain-containing protein n=1 Tax=Azonexus sp. TaxID=1872668 RepID=UPI00283AB138|nr:FapA family protein [Azonexus sp.]
MPPLAADTEPTSAPPVDLLSGLVFVQDGKTVLASFEPATLPPETSQTALTTAVASALDRAGFGACRVRDEALVELSRTISAGHPVAAFPVADVLDGEVSLTFDADLMTATLTIFPPRGGDPVDENAIHRALAEHNVVYGVDDEAIRQAIASAATGTEGGIVVARGKKPAHGQDGRLQLLLEIRSRVPQIDSSGRVDYRNLGDILTVQAGTPLLRRIHATHGEAGKTITGRDIPAKKGKDVAFSHKLEGVSINPKNLDELIAAQGGQPVEVLGGVMVEPTFQSKNVNIATGNVVFEGSVTIDGDVQAGMTVKAGGDIEIGGTVEDATLEAGGNIRIKGGVVGSLGHPEAEPRHIRCKGSFSAAFVQQAAIDAGEAILIDDFAMLCHLTAGQRIVIGDKKRGLLIGGVARAGILVKARVIGSAAQTETRIEVGDTQEFHKERDAIAHVQSEKSAQLGKLVQLMAVGKKQPERMPPGFIEKAESSRLHLLEELEELGQRADLLQQQMDLAATAKVEIESGVFEGVVIRCAGQIYRVNDPRNHGMVFALDGEGGLSWR